MENKVELSKQLFKKGYNCAQSVFGSFAVSYGINFKDAVKISSAFGKGIDKTKNICGALTGMLMAAGLIFGDDNLNNKNFNITINKLIYEFKNKHGSTICCELKKDNINNSCIELCASATDILSKAILNDDKCFNK